MVVKELIDNVVGLKCSKTLRATLFTCELEVHGGDNKTINKVGSINADATEGYVTARNPKGNQYITFDMMKDGCVWSYNREDRWNEIDCGDYAAAALIVDVMEGEGLEMEDLGKAFRDVLNE